MKEKNIDSNNYEKDIKTSYPFLFVRKGYWKNNVGQLLDMNDSDINSRYYMSEDYLKRCIGTLEKNINIFNYYKINGYEETLEELSNNKMKELKEALKRRI